MKTLIELLSEASSRVIIAVTNASTLHGLDLMSLNVRAYSVISWSRLSSLRIYAYIGYISIIHPGSLTAYLSIGVKQNICYRHRFF